MTVEIPRRRAQLWIIRWHKSLAASLRSDIVASIVMFYVPVMVAGTFLQRYYQTQIFSLGIVAALSWLAVAPLLISNAFDHVTSFFDSHKQIFMDEREWDAIYTDEVARLQSKRHVVPGLVWAGLVTFVIVSVKFRDAVHVVHLWAALAFFLLFFLSAIGFHGVFVLVGTIRRICAANISFNPFHPDRFGGISDLGRFSVKVSLYFSSGALAFPLVLEIIEESNVGANTLFVLTYALAGAFLLTLVASFIVPIFGIKQRADTEKERIVLESRKQLDKLIADFRSTPTLDVKLGADILVHFFLYDAKLANLKDYPYDFRVGLEFASSFIIPIAVVLLTAILS